MASTQIPTKKDAAAALAGDTDKSSGRKRTLGFFQLKVPRFGDVDASADYFIDPRLKAGEEWNLPA